MPARTDFPGVNELLTHAVEAVGGAERPGQVEMADAVGRAIRTGEHLAVQAGTGTGKSLAYLVPAIRHAVEKEATVVVSTATIALQRQLVDRDLPRLAKALKKPLGREPTFAILKGRRNYLCLHRLDTGAPDEPEDAQLFDPFAVSRLGKEVKRLHEWSSDTETGDRDELVPGVSEQAWRQVSVTAKECLGASRCPIGTDCFAERARAEAGRADIVVTNHALLAIDALQGYQVLPEHDLVIIDEAHDLVDRVTSVATARADQRDGLRRGRARCGKLIDADIADRLMEAGDGLALVLDDLPAGRLDALPQPLTGALPADPRRRARLHHRARLGPQGRRRRGHRAQAGALAAGRGARHRGPAAGGVRRPTRRTSVTWCGSTGDKYSANPRPPALKVAPLGVAGLLRERRLRRSTPRC